MGIISICDCEKMKQNDSLHEHTSSSISNNLPLSNMSQNEKTDSSENGNYINNKLVKKVSKSSLELISVDKAVIIGKNSGNIKDTYDFDCKLGGGSFGQVFLAKHKTTKENVAIKVMKKTQSSVNSDNIEKEKEIEVLKTMEHQNIVRIFEFYEGKKYYYIVTEFIEGNDLFKLIKNEGKQNEITTAIIMFQLFSAINYCNQRKIMHRDLKPENIMIENKKLYGYIHIKVIDFGTATFYQKGNEKQLAGTPYYIAPEVLDKNYNEKCDIWSLGVIMYLLLVGKYPFHGKTSEEIFDNIKNCKYDKKILFNDKNISNEARELLFKLLIVNPNERIDINDAVNDKWFKKLKIKEKLSEIKPSTIKSILNNIKHYKPNKILQQASIAYIVHNNPNITEAINANILYLKIDINNDGVIEKYEFFSQIKKLFEENNYDEDNDNSVIDNNFLEEIFDIIDTDNSGTIEYEEFLRAAIDKKVLIEEKNLKFAFDFYDKDKNGFITLDELNEVFNKENGNEFSKDEFKKIIDEVDLNKDGFIDFEEFKIMMNKILNE
jgi:calcium-dependent protein kinase